MTVLSNHRLIFSELDKNGKHHDIRIEVLKIDMERQTVGQVPFIKLQVSVRMLSIST